MNVASIGTFDGVHLGHQSVLKMMLEYSRRHDMHPIAVTFRNHPLTIIAPERAPKALTAIEEKTKLLEESGVTAIVLDFDEKLKSTSAADWMKRMKDEYDVSTLVLGYDNTFGCDGRNMSAEDYKRLGERLGMEILIAEEIKGVSSSAIREAVERGNMEKAGEMLGRPYSLTAEIVMGNHIGRTIGFPTANMRLPEGMALPKPGVFAAMVKLHSEAIEHPAMVNIGSHPTVKREDGIVIETHLIDWEGDLYGKEITVKFLKRLRDEKKFGSLEELKYQLTGDKEVARSISERFPGMR